MFNKILRVCDIEVRLPPEFVAVHVPNENSNFRKGYLIELQL